MNLNSFSVFFADVWDMFPSFLSPFKGSFLDLGA